MLLASTVTAVLAGSTVRAAILLKLEWLTSTSRFWLGNGTLTTDDGQEWLGAGEAVSIDGLSRRTDLAAEAMTIKLSGVSAEMVAKVRDGSSEAKGRPATIFLQFFDEDWQTLDSPVAIQSGLMDVVSYRAISATEREVSVTVEGLFAARGSAPFAYYTDRDQQARFPGDLGMEQVNGLTFKVVTWPDF